MKSFQTKSSKLFTRPSLHILISQHCLTDWQSWTHQSYTGPSEWKTLITSRCVGPLWPFQTGSPRNVCFHVLYVLLCLFWGYCWIKLNIQYNYLMTELLLVFSEDMTLAMESRASDKVNHCEPSAHTQLVWSGLAHGITWYRSHDVSGSQSLGSRVFSGIVQ